MKRINGKLTGRLTSPEYGTTMTFRCDGSIQSAIIKTNDAKTLTQTYQRLKLPNLGSFYKANKVALQKAFEGSVISIFAELMRYNATSASLPVGITRDQKKIGACVAMPYVVSEGSMRAINFLNANGQTDLALRGLSAISDETTVGQFAQAVVEANPADFHYDDRITFIGSVQGFQGSIPVVYPCYSAITLIKDSDDLLLDLVQADHFKVVNGHLGCAPFTGVYTFVHSRRDAETGQLELSLQKMYNNNADMIALFTDPDHLRAAAESYDISIENAAVLEPDTAEARQIMRMFGINREPGINQAPVVENGITFTSHEGKTILPGQLGMELVGGQSINVSMVQPISGTFQFKLNGMTVSGAAMSGGKITATVPAQLDGAVLNTVVVLTESATYRADFDGSVR